MFLYICINNCSHSLSQDNFIEYKRKKCEQEGIDQKEKEISYCCWYCISIEMSMHFQFHQLLCLHWNYTTMQFLKNYKWLVLPEMALCINKFTLSFISIGMFEMGAKGG